MDQKFFDIGSAFFLFQSGSHLPFSFLTEKAFT